MRGVAGAVLILVLLCACGQQQDGSAAVPPAEAEAVQTTVVSASAADLPPEVMARWSRSCALCHVTGEGGAPRIGNAEEWGPRLATGRDLLLQHTIEGFNNMPPLGYCMSCEQTDFVALIDFMAESSR